MNKSTSNIDEIIPRKNVLIIKLKMLSEDINRLEFKIRTQTEKYKEFYFRKKIHNNKLKKLKKEYEDNENELNSIIEILTEN